MGVIGKSFLLRRKADLLETLLAGKRLVTVDYILSNEVPPTDYYIYVKLNSADAPAQSNEGGTERRQFAFDEINENEGRPTGRRVALDVCDPELIDCINLITQPINVFLVDCALVVSFSSTAANRVSLFDIELEMGGELSKDACFYAIASEPPSIADSLPLTVDCVTLKDLFESPKLNLYGVIKAVYVSENEPKIRLTLTDPFIGYETHVTCYLTSDSSAHPLPVLSNVGDVIRLHRISAKKQHGDSIQLWGRMGKSGLSWLLFDGRPGSDLTPRSSSENYSLSNSDYETAAQLREWYVKERDIPASERREKRITDLRHMELTHYANILIQVIGIFQGKGSSRPVVIRGWDGTKCARKTLKVDHEREQLEVFSYDKDVAHMVEQYAVDVFVYDEHKQEAVKLESGQYVLLKNVHFGFCKVPDYTLSIHGGDGGEHKRGIERVNENDPRVAELKQKLNACVDRFTREDGSNRNPDAVLSNPSAEDAGVAEEGRQPPPSMRADDNHNNDNDNDGDGDGAEDAGPSRSELPAADEHPQSTPGSSSQRHSPRKRKQPTASNTTTVSPTRVATRITSVATSDRGGVASATRSSALLSRSPLSAVRSPHRRSLNRGPAEAAAITEPNLVPVCVSESSLVYSQPSAPVTRRKTKGAVEAEMNVTAVTRATAAANAGSRPPANLARKGNDDDQTTSNIKRRLRSAGSRISYIFDESISGLSSSSSSSSSENNSDKDDDDNEATTSCQGSLRRSQIGITGEVGNSSTMNLRSRSKTETGQSKEKTKRTR